jgi:hypothetical protein
VRAARSALLMLWCLGVEKKKNEMDRLVACMGGWEGEVHAVLGGET